MERRDGYNVIRIKHTPQPEIIARSSYLNCLSLAVARTRSSYFRADIESWNNAVLQAKHSQSAQLPFLSEIKFQKTDSGEVSDQVRSFLDHAEAQSYLERLVTPDGECLRLTASTRREIEDRERFALQSFTTEINNVANILDEQVGIPQEE